MGSEEGDKNPFPVYAGHVGYPRLTPVWPRSSVGRATDDVRFDSRPGQRYISSIRLVRSPISLLGQCGHFMGGGATEDTIGLFQGAVGLYSIPLVSFSG